MQWRQTWVKWWPYMVAGVAFGLDQVSKWWASAFLAEHGETVLTSWLTIRETYNRGVAFGLFQGIGPWVGWLSILIVLGMSIYLWWVPQEQWLTRLGVGLIIGGALGNLIDRVTAGAVLDFIETPFRSGIFNVADVMINAGMILVILATLIEKAEAQPLPPSQKVSNQS